MAIGTGLAIGLGLLGAGSSIANSAIAARGSRNAARTQEQAADRAMAFQREMYQEARGRLNPYEVEGNKAMVRLSSMLNANGRSEVPGQTPPPFQVPPRNGGGPRTPDVQTLSSYGRPVGRGQTPAAAAQGGGQMVMLQSPDGKETREVPAGDAQRWIARGARVVG
jgi:hypothetical protein